jgi:hypothetical protein
MICERVDGTYGRALLNDVSISRFYSIREVG